MRTIRIPAFAAAFLSASAAMAAPGACPPAGQWFDPSTGETLTSSEAIARLSTADAILLGESHGDPDMHLWQATTAAAIAARRDGAQYGYEMLPRVAQPTLDAWAKGEIGRHEFLTGANWPAVWGFPADAYDPILRLPRLQAAPAIALNVNRDLVRKVGRDGWGGVPLAEREGLTDPAPASPAYIARLDEVLARKAAGAAPDFAERHGEKTSDGDKERQRRHFIEAQLVWDRAFAEGIAGALKARPTLPVVAFMGSGHVEYGHGVAHQLYDLGVASVRTAVATHAGPDCALEPDDAGLAVADLVYGLPSATTEPGPPPRPRIGVFIQDALGGGAEITRVVDGSPAAEAGFQAGDVVTEAAGQPIAGASELGALIRTHAWGAWLPFAVKRAEATQEFVVKLPKSPPPDAR